MIVNPNSYLRPNWPQPHLIHAYTTLRESSPADLSAGATQILCERLNLPESPLWLNQTHSTRVLALNSNPPADSYGDACFTYNSLRVCAVRTADCLPILLCTADATYVAAIHAGWRGLARGIIEATLAQAPADRSSILAWLGPAINRCHFEVGQDVYTAFTQSHPAAIDAFTPHPVQADKWFADLYHLATQRLQTGGVDQIYGGEYCTYDQPELFFSHRRAASDSRRLISLIWIGQS